MKYRVVCHRAKLDAYYSSYTSTPSYTRCEFHFVIENDKCIKINKGPQNGTYVYFSL